MPLFEYKCTQCGHVTEFLEKPGSRKRHACEKCGSPETEKALSSFTAQARGPGRRDECPTCTGPSCADAACRTGSCPY